MVNRCINFILSSLYPPRCLLCGAAGWQGMDICHGCFNELPWNRHCCPLCALPLDTATSNLTACGHCQRETPPLCKLFAPLLYRDPVDHLIQGFKFRDKMNHGRLLAQLFLAALPSAPSVPSTLIPVPLHHRRLRQRGFNQSLVLARHLAKQLPNLQLEPHRISRRADTQPQAGLKAKERRRNLKQAFELRGELADRPLIVLDDVVTTATTVNTVCSTLIRAGRRRESLQVWALARTPETSDQ